MYKYIKNPVNNKKVNIYSKLGKNIIRHYLNFIIGGADAPPKNYTDISHQSKYIFNQISENITQIYGIIGLNYYKFDTWYGTKRILLLSDEHKPLVETIPSQEAILYVEFIVYLIQSLANFNKCVDFYLEMPLMLEQGRPLKGGMYRSDIEVPTSMDSVNLLRWIFIDCTRIVNNFCTIQKVKGKTYVPTETKLDNLRLHNIDLRKNMEHDDGVTSLGGPLSDCFTDEVSKTFFEQFLQFVLEIPGHPTREEILDMSLKEPGCDENKINEFLDKIEKVKIKIHKEQIKFNNNNIFKRHIDLNKLIYESRKSLYSRAWKISKKISLKGALVDIYTTLRVLKNFQINTEDKMTRGPLRCKGIAEQDNIIVYAGAAHIRHYKYVFSQILPADSCIYSQENGDIPKKKDSIVGNISKILKIDTSWRFKNFNELMTDFCEDLSNHSINFYKLNNNTIRLAVERYKNNMESCPPIEEWNVSQVTDMSELFKDSSFNSDITNWNTSNVANMSAMFYQATSFNQPLEWNTENVEDMSFMFQGAESFNQTLNFSNTRNVKDMSAMFFQAENFDQPLNFDTRNVRNMSQMFALAENFNQPIEWNTQNVTDMSYMFYSATSFNQDLKNWNTNNVTDMKDMFEGVKDLEQA